MNRQELEAQAKRLKIDISNMEWNDSVSVISEALRKEEAEAAQKKDDEIKKLRERLQEKEQRVQELEVSHEGRAPGRAPSHEEYKKPIIVAPEIPANAKNIPNYSYKEELGYDLDYEEVKMNLHDFAKNMNDNAIGKNYKVRGKKLNKVVADTAGPRYNPGIRFDPTKHYATVALENGIERGYIYSSPVYFDIRDLISDINFGIYLDKYHNEIIKNEFMVGGHICLPIPFVNRLMQRIEDEEQRKAARGEEDGVL